MSAARCVVATLDISGGGIRSSRLAARRANVWSDPVSLEVRSRICGLNTPVPGL